MGEISDIEAVAEFEYIAVEDDELTIRVGDVIASVEKLDGGWWKGTLNGKQGMFPDNFVKEVKKDKSKDPVTRARPGSTVSQLTNKLGKDAAKTVQPLPTATAKPEGSKIRKCKVHHSYEPQGDDELRLEVGNVVDFIKEDCDGWYQGSLNDQTGVFPSNFVEFIDDDVDSSTSLITPKKKTRGPGYGDIFKEGPIRLKTVKGAGGDQGELEPLPRDGGDNKMAVVSPREQWSTTKQNPSTPKAAEKAKVLYKYVAENDDELSLEKGDIVNVLDKDSVDSGWWKGELNGRIGVFPDNFVEILPFEETRPPKKPAPPTVAMTGGAKQKQVPTPEPAKTTQKKEETKEKTLPRGASVPTSASSSSSTSASTSSSALAPKRTVPPPPVGKKPAAQRTGDAQQLITQTDEYKAREQLAEQSADIQRSKDAQSQDAQATKRTSVQDRKIPPMQPNTTHLATTSDQHRPHEHSNISEDVSGVAGPTSGEIMGIVEELRREIRLLKETTISKEKYDILAKEVASLRTESQTFKKLFSKEILQLVRNDS